MNYAKHREHLLEWIRSQLTGLVTNKGKKFGVSVMGRQLDPEEKSETLRGIAPVDRYPTGVLYPVYKGTEGIDPASVTEEDEENESPDASDSTIPLAQSAKKQQRYVPPSSVGFSFFVRGGKIEFQVICSAIRYEQKGKPSDMDMFMTTKDYLPTIGIEFRFVILTATPLCFVFRSASQMIQTGNHLGKLPFL